ncbi:MAG: hypothetical protein H0V66_06025 [Bdellovibrionales bacterium]|nr:hypothetical protein [Bdellovibrionales bacterium]
MKLLLALSTLLAFGSAHASYMATHCSNSTTSVKWETGHNSNTMTLKHYDREEREVVIPFYDLDVKFASEAVIKEERIHNCGYASYTRIFAGKVVITASEHNPAALDFLGENKKIETEVICTTHMNSRAPCPEETIETTQK